jgi:hypothetical protein
MLREFSFNLFVVNSKIIFPSEKLGRIQKLQIEVQLTILTWQAGFALFLSL